MRRLLPILLFVALPATAAAAILPATPDWTAESNIPGRGLGSSVHTAGDVNGDGMSDLLVSGVGTVRLYLGGASGSPLDPSRLVFERLGLTGTPWVSAAGDVNGDGRGDVAIAWSNVFRVYYGSGSGLDTTSFFAHTQSSPAGLYSLRTAPAGDVNRDGYDDVLLSNSLFGLAAPPCNNPSAGQVVLYYGSATGLSAASIWSDCGGGTGYRHGESIAGTGDVNGDGYDDFVVGEPGSGPFGLARTYLGGALGPSAHQGLVIFADIGNESDFIECGAAVAGAGDVDGDGYADVLVGAPRKDDTALGRVDCGIVRLFRGGAGGVNGTASWGVFGQAANERFGSVVSTAGDLDGDGYADLAAGGPNSHIPGRVQVFAGSSAGPVASGFNLVTPDLPALAGGGDLDGDGHSELIVGVPGYDHPEADEGAVWIFRGRGEWPDAALPTTWTGAQNTGYLGWCVARAGDFNGDGFADVVVGEPLWDGFATDEGRLLLYLGSAVGLPSSPSSTFSRSVPGQTGLATACAGDINGDGYADVVVGAHVAGVVDILYGNDTGQLAPGGYHEIWGSFQFQAYFGAAVAGGDINGDGYGDIVVGEPYWDGPLGADQGRVYVFISPGAGGITTGQSPAMILDGTQSGEHFGGAVSVVGDVNRDGYSDVVVGAPYYDQGGLADAGRIALYQGPGFTPVSPTGSHFGGQAFTYFGSTIAGLDFDDNGYADYAVGGYGYGGGGMFRLFWSGSVLPPAQIDSPQPGAAFGSSVSAAGDVNGDGYGDLVVGAVFFNGLSNDDGRMFLWHGNPFGIFFSPEWWTDGGQAFANLGHVVAGVGDVNGDGFDDVAGGAPGWDNGATPQAGFVKTYLGNAGVGIARPLWSVRAGGGLNVVEGGRTGDPDEYTLRGLARSAAGRTTVRMQWVNDRALGGALALEGLGNWYPTAAPAPGQGSALLITQGVPGLSPDTPYGWRARFRTRSVYFPTSPWTAPGVNGRLADLRTNPSPVAVPGRVDAGGPRLAQPRPNPSSGPLAIEYALPRGGEANLTVFDPQGRAVRRLARGAHEAGSYRALWDGRDESGRTVAPGLYFLTLETPEARHTRRVVRLE